MASLRLVVLATALAGVAAGGQQGDNLPYGSLVAPVPLPPCEVIMYCNGVMCTDTCRDGTIQVDPWAAWAIRFQYDLALNRSIRDTQILATHNAFISKANGMGSSEDAASAIFSATLPLGDATTHIPNQRYGATDLLNFGIRELEIDLWDIPWPYGPMPVYTGADAARDAAAGKPVADGLNFTVHVCHSPVPDPNYLAALAQSSASLNFTGLNFDPFREWCSNSSLEWALAVVNTWLTRPENADQVVALYLDNRVWTPNIDLVTAAVTGAFLSTNNSLLTPADVAGTFGGRFPSRAQMLAAGKRVYVESNSYFSNDYSNTSLASVAFYPTTWSNYQEDPDVVSPYPNCTINGWAGWYGGPNSTFTRILDSSVTWYPDGDERGSGGMINIPSGLTDLLLCGFQNIAMSDIRPDTMMPAAVWSWSAGEPAAGVAAGRVDRSIGADGVAANCSAAAVTQVRGRWTAQSCARTLHAACRRGDPVYPSGHDATAWALTAPVSFYDAPAACASLGPDWSFDPPRDGRENALLAWKALLEQRIWSRASPGIWLNVPAS